MRQPLVGQVDAMPMLGVWLEVAAGSGGRRGKSSLPKGQPEKEREMSRVFGERMGRQTSASAFASRVNK